MDENAWKKFITLTSSLSLEELEVWFDLLLTPAEREDLHLRMQIIKGLLAENLPQRELAKTLNVSISKITRGSNALKSMPEPEKALLRQMMLSIPLLPQDARF